MFKDMDFRFYPLTHLLMDKNLKTIKKISLDSNRQKKLHFRCMVRKIKFYPSDPGAQKMVFD
jgi:hypothetical protein